MSGKKPRKGQRTGFTTGACAAAASRAAVLGLLHGRIPVQVEMRLPNGDKAVFNIHEGGGGADGSAVAVVVKDAGDDPDCTHGARITAQVRQLSQPHQPPGTIHLLGGEGVGRVTRPGLGLTVGEPAINPVPRQNILENVRAVAEPLLVASALEITLMVPGGAVMAKKTLNPRLGIVGGISILGTSGIVYPYSTTAFKAVVSQSVVAAAALGLKTVVFATGRRTERFAMAQHPELPPNAFIQMGDFVGAALESAGSVRMPRVMVAAMVGKLAKISQGVANTHAHKGVLDMETVAEAAGRAGAGRALREAIRKGATVRYAAELLQPLGLRQPFYEALARATAVAVRRRLPPETITQIMAFDFEGGLLAVHEGVADG